MFASEKLKIPSVSKTSQMHHFKGSPCRKLVSINFVSPGPSNIPFLSRARMTPDVNLLCPLCTQQQQPEHHIS